MSRAPQAAERWVPIPGWAGYDISDCGRIRSWRQMRKSGLPRIMLPHLRNGYPSVDLFRDGGERKGFTIHRMMLNVFVGPAPSKVHHAAHCDGNKTNNHLSNLRWATPSENSYDKRLNGTHQCGQFSATSKLTSSQVDEIKRRGANGEPRLKLAFEFGVSRSTIRGVVLGLRYSCGCGREASNA